MTTLRRLLSVNDVPLKIGTVKSARGDGRYDVDIEGRTRVVRAAQGALSPGRRVAVSKVGGRWVVTNDLKNFESTRTVTVVVNG